ncbi:MAG: hypothetical protein ACPGLV_09535 [Bacteroidia bacterium]
MKTQLALVLIFFALSSTAQNFNYRAFNNCDSLRGALNPQRNCYDVKSYDLNIEFDFENQTIKGFNNIFFEVKTNFRVLQIDLFKELAIDSIVHGGYNLKFKRKCNAVFVELQYEVLAEHHENLKVYYHGKPNIAIKPPWNGGFVWDKDPKGKHWVSVACEGYGASSWWPCKDHLSDEPDSMKINLTVPKGYTAVSNGKLSNTVTANGNSTFTWNVSYPINNYNVTFYIANFAKINADYKGLSCTYYVLSKNKKMAKKHFATEVPKMFDAFEHYFGKYPFANDGYKIVEAPYWGMEHQSAIAYGNEFKKNKKKIK